MECVVRTASNDFHAWQVFGAMENAGVNVVSIVYTLDGVWHVFGRAHKIDYDEMDKLIAKALNSST